MSGSALAFFRVGMVQLRCLLALLGCKVVSYTGAQMDAEQIIAEIECLEHIFAQPDTRPLSPDDLSAVNQRHDEMHAHSPWFRLWQPYGICCRS